MLARALWLLGFAVLWRGSSQPAYSWDVVIEGAEAAGPLGSELVSGQRVYVSMTSIRSRLSGVAPTIESIFLGTLKPDRLFVLLSNQSHLLDSGVSRDEILSHPIAELARKWPLTVVLTENIGPHRKLLPLLSRKWSEDCVIVTVDDHELYPRSMLESLLKFYLVSRRKSVVALRSRRMGICSQLPWQLTPYTRNRRGLWPEMSPGRREMLVT